MEDNIKKPIKICHVTTVDITVKFIILNFLKDLKREGYHVYAVCSFLKWKDSIEKEGIVVKDIKMTRRMTPFSDLVSFIKLFLYFRKEKFNIVHTYTPKAGVLGRIAARLAGTPVVIHTSYGFYVGAKIPKWQKKVMMLAEKIAAKFCDLVFSQNKEDVEMAIREKIIDSKKVDFLNYGIDIDRFNPDKFDSNFILQKKRELGVENKKIIGMVGRFVKEKGYLDLFSAFSEIKEKSPDTRLVIVAPKDKVKQDALDISVLKEYGIESEVVVLGHEKEILNIEEIYSIMDIFVLPSYREGFPYSIMEASASGKITVATNIRGCREAVEDGVTGKLVPIGNSQELASALMYFLDNPDKAKELGNNARRKAVREFNEKLVFEIINKEYKRLMKEKICE